MTRISTSDEVSPLIGQIELSSVTWGPRGVLEMDFWCKMQQNICSTRKCCHCSHPPVGFHLSFFHNLQSADLFYFMRLGYSKSSKTVVAHVLIVNHLLISSWLEGIWVSFPWFVFLTLIANCFVCGSTLRKVVSNTPHVPCVKLAFHFFAFF